MKQIIPVTVFCFSIILLSINGLPKTHDTCLVLYIFDGDTIQVQIDDAKETVRLIGIDAPEIKHENKSGQFFGEESLKYAKTLLQAKTIRLERDSLCADRDIYGRLLRYVYIGDILFNAKIIEDGYAYAYCTFPFEKKAKFLELEKEARRINRGLWAAVTEGINQKNQNQVNSQNSSITSTTDSSCKPEFVASKKSRVFHHRDCELVKSISQRNLLFFNSYEEATHSGRRPCKVCRGTKEGAIASKNATKTPK
ncbi:MAG: hypothetical protein A2161_03200 [Candidatus Schekmanbacteria bacterium RBG_13_48_7]|uniref:TNase-like domain-containing protein n=1 Tax=Candidatus Schekmanbacteria bacterium RBG_13_48_7 TaxID=1817878 RepID=A0A1F7RT90_9BACT|nr:MAG: hypothetical protein A2161_03200 [Candidatus Schekmanbacteria bacterium RBG_13_48_7]